MSVDIKELEEGIRIKNDRDKLYIYLVEEDEVIEIRDDTLYLPFEKFEGNVIIRNPRGVAIAEYGDDVIDDSLNISIPDCYSNCEVDVSRRGKGKSIETSIIKRENEIIIDGLIKGEEYNVNLEFDETYISIDKLDPINVGYVNFREFVEREVELDIPTSIDGKLAIIDRFEVFEEEITNSLQIGKIMIEEYDKISISRIIDSYDIDSLGIYLLPDNYAPMEINPSDSVSINELESLSTIKINHPLSFSPSFQVYNINSDFNVHDLIVSDKYHITKDSKITKCMPSSKVIIRDSDNEDISLKNPDIVVQNLEGGETREINIEPEVSDITMDFYIDNDSDSVIMKYNGGNYKLKTNEITSFMFNNISTPLIFTMKDLKTSEEVEICLSNKRLLSNPSFYFNF
jgi:NACalpha-BTF3-like transcription factor